tara:strand:+ start:5286 stop:6191 length:906 start_codon:yes stop_codon:yes gene_type:complete
MNCFCTIITSNYYFYAETIFDSLKKKNPIVDFKVLIVDDFPETYGKEGLDVISLNEVVDKMSCDYELIRKYENDKKSNLRWALKPLFLKFLINFKNYQKVIFVDPDLYFYQNTSFLFDKLNKADVIITPHWRSKDPVKDASNFDSLFSGGLFNAGFFGCNAKAINILDWWLNACAYKMEKTDGFYVDQGYLNLMPIYFSSQVKIIQHKGCNVSNWNLIECERTKSQNEVLINDEYPVVFIHFTNATITAIWNGKDKFLRPFLEEYKTVLQTYNKNFKFNYEKETKKRDSSLGTGLKKIFKL